MSLEGNFYVTHNYSIELSASYIYCVQPILYQKQLGNISLSVQVSIGVMGSVIFVCIECLVQKLERQSYVQAHTHFLIFFSMGGPTEWLFACVREHTPNTLFLRCKTDSIFHSPMSVLMVSLCTFPD